MSALLEPPPPSAAGIRSNDIVVGEWRKLDDPIPPSPFHIHIPSTPPHLTITQSQIEDLFMDPVMAAELIMGEIMDEFQKCRARDYWFSPRLIDSSGFSSFKTRTAFVVSNLRCILIPDHWCTVYYQNFNVGQKNFWQLYETFMPRSALFRAQIGRVALEDNEKELKGTTKGPSCWTCFFKNGSRIFLPAPGFITDARSQAGLRTNDLVIDEWTKVEGSGSTGIDDQLIGRTSRESYNKNHPVWCNHHLFLSTAEDTLHPAYDRFRKFQREVEKGNPEYSVPSFSFKDISDRPSFSGSTFKQKLREDRLLADMKKKFSKAKYLQEVLGRWSHNGRQWYTVEALDKAVDIGKDRKLAPMCHRRDGPSDHEGIRYFLGADPAKGEAKKADDGALVVLRAEPLTSEYSDRPSDWRLDFVWAYKVRGASATQWAAMMHFKQKHFNFTGIMMDRGGGGIWIRDELAKTKQIIYDIETTVIPIVTPDDLSVVHGNYCLNMFSPSDDQIKKKWDSLKGDDSLIDAAHCEFAEALDGGLFGFPMPLGEWPKEVTDRWTDEKLWACRLLELVRRQLANISVAVDPTGKYLLTKNNAHQFSSKGKKDFAYAAIHAYARFLVWLANSDSEYRVAEEDEAMCC